MTKFTPRRHQILADQAESKETERLRLYSAAPGTGKTIADCMIANRHFNANEIDLQLYLCPRSPLKIAYRNDFSGLFGKEIITEFDSNRGLPPGYCGIAMTYSQLVAGENANAIRELSKNYRMRVTLDEVHHLSINNIWGRKTAWATELAVIINGLSGTIYRTDNDAISLVPLNGKQGDKNRCYKPYAHYGLYNGILDNVIVPPMFITYDGELNWRTVEEEYNIKLGDSDSIPLEQLSNARKTFCDFRSAPFLKMLDDFVDRTLDERKKQNQFCPMGLVVGQGKTANDEIRQIEEISHYMTKRYGDKGRHELVLHDTENSDEVINNAKESELPFLLSIRMVTEGVNIPRITTLLFATATTTELSLNQIAGRPNRVMPGKNRCFIYMPNDQEMKIWAARITKECGRAIKTIEQELEKHKDGDSDKSTTSNYQFLGTGPGDKEDVICPLNGLLEAKWIEEGIKWAAANGIVDFDEVELGFSVKALFEKFRKGQEPQKEQVKPNKSREEREKDAITLLNSWAKVLKKYWFSDDIKTNENDYIGDPDAYSQAKRKNDDENSKKYKETWSKMRILAGLPGRVKQSLEGSEKMIKVIGEYINKNNIRS